MHRFIDYGYILATILFTVYGQLILKWRIGDLGLTLPADGYGKVVALVKLLFDPYIFSGLVLAVFASLAWMAAMTKFELSAAYPFMALNFVLVLIIAVPVFGESLTLAKVVGTCLIVAGTILIGKG